MSALFVALLFFVSHATASSSSSSPPVLTVSPNTIPPTSPSNLTLSFPLTSLSSDQQNSLFPTFSTNTNTTVVFNATLTAKRGGSADLGNVSLAVREDGYVVVRGVFDPFQLPSGKAPEYLLVTLWLVSFSSGQNGSDSGAVAVAGAVFVTADCDGKLGVFGGNGLPCRPCPANAVCPGGRRMWPRAGYYAIDETAGRVSPCLPASRCVGGDPKDPAGLCARGSEGLFCSRCEPGYYLAETVCLRCSRGVPFALLMAIYVVVLLALALGISAVSHASSGDAFAAVGMVQMVWLLGQCVPDGLPAWIRGVYSAIAVVALQIDFLRLPCENFNASLPNQYLMLVAAAGSVLGFSWLVVPVRVAIKSWLHNRKQFTFSEEAAKLELVRVGVVSLCLSYIPLTFRTCEVLFCTQSSLDGKLRLLADRATVCYEGRHMTATLVALLVFCIVVVGLPALVFVKLAPRHAASLSRRSHVIRFGIFFSRYRLPPMARFSLVNMLAALLVTFGAVSLRSHRGPLFGWCLVVTLATTAAYVALRPYERAWRNVVGASVSMVLAAQTLLHFLSWDRLHVRKGGLTTLAVVCGVLLLGVMGGIVLFSVLFSRRLDDMLHHQTHNPHALPARHFNPEDPEPDHDGVLDDSMRRQLEAMLSKKGRVAVDGIVDEFNEAAATGAYEHDFRGKQPPPRNSALPRQAANEDDGDEDEDGGGGGHAVGGREDEEYFRRISLQAEQNRKTPVPSNQPEAEDDPAHFTAITLDDDDPQERPGTPRNLMSLIKRNSSASSRRPQATAAAPRISIVEEEAPTGKDVL